MMGRIKCLKCDIILESKHVHDFVACKCKGEKKTYLDGGHDYQRILWGGKGGDMEEYVEILPSEKCIEKEKQKEKDKK